MANGGKIPNAYSSAARTSSPTARGQKRQAAYLPGAVVYPGERPVGQHLSYSWELHDDGGFFPGGEEPPVREGQGQTVVSKASAR